MEYAICAKKQQILLFHPDINLSYVQRRDSLWENHLRAVRETIRVATGLKSPRMTFNIPRGLVMFHLSTKHFTQAAVAVRLAHGEPSEHI